MRERYGWTLISLHWLTLLLILAAYTLGALLQDMPLSPTKLKLYAWHKWIGMLVLFLLPLRALLRWLDGFDQRRDLRAWEASLSGGVHAALYLLMLLVPLFGWLHSSAAGFPVVWFGALPLPDLVGKDKVLAEVFKELHASAINLLVILIALHAAAALYHHYFRRDGVLTRMLPWLRRRT